MKTLDRLDLAFRPDIKREQFENLHELCVVERVEKALSRRIWMSDSSWDWLSKPRYMLRLRLFL